MKIKKSELKSIIKECVAEVLAENSQLQPYDFDADWNRMDEAGVPVIHLTEEEYKTHICEATEIWKKRNMIHWDLDLSLITTNNITLSNAIPNKDDRTIICETNLNQIYGR